MHDLIVTFCEDRRSWLVVIAGTLGLVLVLLVPAVDDYIALSAEKTELTGQLALAENSATHLDQYRQLMATRSRELATSRDATLHEGNLTDFRNGMVKVVRESGCQLRRLNISNPQTRVWAQGDNPLAEQEAKDAKPSGFELETRVVTLSLVGNSTNAHRLLESIETQDNVVHLHNVEMRSEESDGRRVEAALELWYFTLRRAAEE